LKDPGIWVYSLHRFIFQRFRKQKLVNISGAKRQNAKDNQNSITLIEITKMGFLSGDAFSYVLEWKMLKFKTEPGRQSIAGCAE
uniref:Uncharacterized protein n=1 Tax=Romanomermis culicivorax TaxID=13658 RepID=A0A915J158_ROMCU